jgi:hypothetical protein
MFKVLSMLVGIISFTCSSFERNQLIIFLTGFF